MGPLTGVPYVTCRIEEISMSRVTIFVIYMSTCKCQCLKSNLMNVMSLIFSLLSIGPKSHVDFEKWPYCRVKFKGQEPPFEAGLGLKANLYGALSRRKRGLPSRMLKRRYHNSHGNNLYATNDP